MEKITGKRVGAFLMDILIVMFITSMFSSLDLINPYIDEYKEANKEYMDVYTNYLLKNSETENDKNSDVSEKNNLETENNENIDVNANSNLLKSEELNDLSYDLTKYSMPTTIIQLVITILYFIVFQYFNSGKTIGKALLKINVVSENGGKLKFVSILIRAFIVNSIFTLLLSIGSFYIFDKNIYMGIMSYVQLIELTLLFVCFAMMIFRLDGKGLHDIVAKTNVVKINNDTFVKEVNYKEKK